jgi:ubiquinone/menaquinone biosynthesis C-methylase UbiE
MFEVADAYEATMGRWSRQLAPLFVEFVGVRDGEKVLDVGCGTGSLSATLARVTGAAKIVGIDPSNGFIEYARTQISDRRVTFEVGDAQALPYPDASFDRCLAIRRPVKRSGSGRRECRNSDLAKPSRMR